ncbi:MAG TPA: cytochrome C [Thermoanaerobaculia bacterium]|nr:cytochrome C [Thermoanaerobaculia bacterium]
MRKFATITLLALAVACRKEIPVNADATASAGTSATTSTAPPGGGPAIVLSSAIPGDAQFGKLPPNATNTQKLLDIQGDFDIYSWNTFIALNWPPGPDGNGDPKKTIGQNGDNDTVWEHYRDVADIFLPGGATPTYNGPEVIPPECKADYMPGMHVISQVGKTPTVLTDFSQPFNTGPLIDQNGIYTRMAILVNKPMYDYIFSNALYSKAGQKAFAGAVKFPCGVLGGAEGAIMVKSAWKVIDPADKGRFHTETALVYTPASQNPKYPATCGKKLMGLVGLHIGHKTNSGAQWLWSTFEQVDNVPSEDDVKSGKFKAKYNYYNPKCNAATCPPNAVPPRPWDPTKVSSFHSQIVRMNMFKGNEFAFTSAAARNADAVKLLAGVNPNSVFQNYELISTMWPTNTGQCQANPGDPLGTPAPNFLANTTLETYIQGMVPNVSSNCIECHNNATMTNAVPSDFTYVLQRAK